MKQSRLKVLSLVMAAALCMTLLPVTALAADGDAMTLGASSIPKGNFIYYGNYGGENIKWKVLSDEGNGGTYQDSGAAMFLLSEYILDNNNVQFEAVWDSDDGDGQGTQYNMWQHSDGQVWCSTFTNSAFDKKEAAAIHKTSKTDNKTDSATGPYNVSWGASSLNEEQVFFISADEAAAYIGPNDGAAGLAATTSAGGAGAWWLRSPYRYNAYNAGAVIDNGFVRDRSVDITYGARPAFNLNLDSVLFASAAAGGKSSGAAGAGALQKITGPAPTEWKLTLRDSSRSGFDVSGETISGSTVSFSYSGAKTGTNEYLSAIIEQGGSITHYGRIKLLDETTESSGTASITLPANVKLGGNVSLYVFNEQYNGDKKTDYASELKSLNPPPAEGNKLLSITQPVPVIGLSNGTAKTAEAMGLPKTVDITTSTGTPTEAEVAWKVDECGYDQTKDEAQTFDVSGTVTLPDGVTNPDNVSLNVTISVTVSAKADPNINSISIKTKPDKTRYTEGDTLDLNGLEITIGYSGGDPKDVPFSDFADSGVSTSPANGAPLTTANTTVTVSVGAYSDSFNITVAEGNKLLSITQPVPVIGLSNGTEKTAEAMGLPETVGITTSSGSPTSASVTWDVNGCSYDPANEKQQEFTVSGTVTLPDGVTNPDNVPLNVTISVTVSAKPDPTVTSVIIKTPPTKTSYTEGDTLDLNGLEITIGYSGGDTADLPYPDCLDSGVSTDPAHGAKLTTANTTVTVSVGGSSVDFDINVTEAEKPGPGTDPDLGTYTISFDINGGDGSNPADMTTTDGKLSSLPAPTRSGYTFVGWFTEKTGGEKITENYTFTADTTVYARWLQGNVTTDVKVNEGAPDTTMENSEDELADKLLDAGDKAAVAGGAKADIWLEISALAENNVPAADKAVISAKAAEKLGNDVEITYLDLSMFKKIGTAAAEKLTGTLDTEIHIVITVPDEIRQAGAFRLIHSHDSGSGAEATIITPDSYDPATGVLKFTTDRFSTYALAYTSTGGGSGSDPDDDDRPNRPSGGGDSSDSWDDHNYEFWDGVKQKVQDAEPGETVKVNARSYDKFPYDLMEALYDRGDVSLEIRWDDGDTFTIPAGKALKPAKNRIFYRLEYLAEQYKDVPAAAPAQEEDPAKLNPSTGVGSFWDYLAFLLCSIFDAA